MSSALTTEARQILILFSSVFDGYRYAEHRWQLTEAAVHPILNEKWHQVQESSCLLVRAEDNFALNFYIHRTFRHWGELPTAGPAWYDMLFLYLHLYRLPVPVEYRRAAEYTQWINRRKGAAEAAAAEVRQLLRGASLRERG